MIFVVAIDRYAQQIHHVGQQLFLGIQKWCLVIHWVARCYFLILVAVQATCRASFCECLLSYTGLHNTPQQGTTASNQLTGRRNQINEMYFFLHDGGYLYRDRGWFGEFLLFHPVVVAIAPKDSRCGCSLSSLKTNQIANMSSRHMSIIPQRLHRLQYLLDNACTQPPYIFDQHRLTERYEGLLYLVIRNRILCSSG